MSYFPKGSLVITDGVGKVTAFSPGLDNYILVSDNTSHNKIKWKLPSEINNFGPTGPTGTTGSQGAGFFPTNILYVDKSGNDVLGQRNGKPFLTINAALSNSLNGDVIIINPGTYNETITVPTGVSIRGQSMFNTIINMSSVISNTDLFSLNPNCLIENLTLNLTSSSNVQLRGIVFLSTSATNSKLLNCAINIDNTTASSHTSKVIAVYSAGTGSCPNYFNNLELVNVNIVTTSTGPIRGILIDTNINTLNAKSCSFRVNGGTNSIAAEINSVGSNLTLRNSYCEGTTADISQTFGNLFINNTRLFNSNANGLGFSLIDKFPYISQYCLSGTVATNATRYMRISDALSTNEIKQTIYQKCLFKNLYVRARIAPGGTNSDVYTIRKNGIDTILFTSLTGTSVTSSNTTKSIIFNAGDDLSLKLVTGLTSASADITVTVELY